VVQDSHSKQYKPPYSAIPIESIFHPTALYTWKYEEREKNIRNVIDLTA